MKIITFYLDLLHILDKATSIIHIQPDLESVSEEAKSHYAERNVYYKEQLFKKEILNFNELGELPAYRKETIEGLIVLNERLLHLEDIDKKLLIDFIEDHLFSVNELLQVIRSILQDLPQTNRAYYVRKFRLEEIQKNELIMNK